MDGHVHDHKTTSIAIILNRLVTWNVSEISPRLFKNLLYMIRKRFWAINDINKCCCAFVNMRMTLGLMGKVKQNYTNHNMLCLENFEDIQLK